MLYTPFNFMCIIIMTMSSIMAMSSSNWMFMWAGMELNLLSFIPLIMLTNSNQETEAAIKYFLAQALGSSIMLMSSLSLWFSSSAPMNFMSSILLMSLILKIGMAPCHLWYPSVMTSISWMSCFILSTWQKLAPLMIITFVMTGTSTNILLFLGAMNALIGGAIGMNQVHLRTIMAYSSITHMGWMISLAAMNKFIPTIIYFLLYSMLIAPIFLIFQKFSISTSAGMNKLMSKAPILQALIPIMLLSLGGLPPLTGFIPKWMTIEIMSQSNPYILLVLIMGAMMNLYFYLNITFNMLLSPTLSPHPHLSFMHMPMNYWMVTSISLLLLTPVLMLI
uniref:NADH-ubiquinone oxidoreductase chain 2 n=1 Tax=Mesenchytraeus solifugus TaxID=223748 RepID=A0A342Y112_MESSO|nr:NADH dehydrogenase subunit 2 [Mesenchytraeus solifugus]